MELPRKDELKKAVRYGTRTLCYAGNRALGGVTDVLQKTADVGHSIQGEPTYDEAVEKAIESRFDDLTGCYNRSSFIESIKEFYESGGTDLVLAFVDLVDLKDINDTKGFNTGSASLIVLAWVMNEYLSEDTIVGRVGGDEFVVGIVPGDHTADETTNRALKPYDKRVFNEHLGRRVIEHRCPIDIKALLSHERDDEALTIPTNVHSAIAELMNAQVYDIEARYCFQHVYFTDEPMSNQIDRFMGQSGLKAARSVRRVT